MTLTDADGVKFHSPVIHSPPFVGNRAVRELLGVILPAVQDLQVTHEATDGEVHVLVLDGSIHGQNLKATWLVSRDAEGRLTEIWVLIRPLRANARILQVVGKGLTRAHTGTAFRTATAASSRGLVQYVDTVTAWPHS